MGFTIELPYGITRTVEILSRFCCVATRGFTDESEALARLRKPSASSAEAGGR